MHWSPTRLGSQLKSENLIVFIFYGLQAGLFYRNSGNGTSERPDLPQNVSGWQADFVSFCFGGPADGVTGIGGPGSH